MVRILPVLLAVVLIAAPVSGALAPAAVAVDRGEPDAVGVGDAVQSSSTASAGPPGRSAPDPPSIEVTALQDTLVAGTTQPITFQVVNDGPNASTRVRNATNVELEVQDLDAIESTSPPAFLGILREGVPRTATARLEVAENAVPGEYDVPVTVTYEYVNETGSFVSAETTTEVTVEVESRAEFRVQSVESNVEVGSTGTMRVRVKNTGGDVAEAASLTLQSSSSAVVFGSSPTANRFVGEWEAGETQTLTFDVTATPGAEPRSYTIQGTVDYENEDGVPQQSAPLRMGVTPSAEQTFAVSGVEGSLEVGERGSISGVVENTGNDTVENAVLVLQSTPPTVTPVEPQYAIGDLEPGERVAFEMEASVSPQAGSGPRQVTFRLQYRSGDGTALASDPMDARVRVDPEQTFSVGNVSSDLQVATDGLVTGTVTNTGGETVENAVVLLRSASPTLTPVEPEYPIGSLAPGESKRFELEALVPGSASAGPRQVTLQVQYSGEDGAPRASDPKDVTVEVAPEQSFDVRDVNSTLRVAEDGTIRGTVVNTGDSAVTDAVVLLQSASPTLTPLEPEYAVGRLEPGQRKTFELEAQVSPRASAGPRQVDLRVQYRNRDGNTRVSDAKSVRVRVGDEQSFAVESVESNLRIGDDGTVTGTLVNTGNRTVENLVVLFSASSPSLSPSEPEYAVGRLEPGERVDFSFDVEVTESAAAGPRQVTFRAQYSSTEGESRTSDPLDAQVRVGDQRDEFAVEVVSDPIAVGKSGQLEVRVTNVGDEPVSSVSAKLYDSSPLSAGVDEVLIERLGPGESTTISFEVSVGSDALANQSYPMEMDFQYDEADGETSFSDIYRLPVATTDGGGGGGGGGGGLPLPVILVGLLVVLAVVGVVAYRRLR